MRARFELLAPLSVLVALACPACTKPTASEHPDAASAPMSASELVAQPEAPAGPPVSFASTGVPHSAAIAHINLSPDAQAALTRDAAGGVRLWAALDGSREPLVVPVREPSSMALAATASQGFTLALIDRAGGMRLVGVSSSGEMEKLASLPPTDPLVEALVLPGGEHLLAVGADHVVRLLDRRGQELARLDETGLRIYNLRLAAESGRVVALTVAEFDSTSDAGRFAVEALELTLDPEAGQLALGAARQTIHLDMPPTANAPALSPDGRTLVYLEQGRAASWTVVAKQLDDGRRSSSETGINSGLDPRLGLLSAGRVLLDDGSGIGRVVDLTKDSIELVPLRSAPTLAHQASVFGPNLRVAPANTWLAVHELDSDSLSYLGYEQISVTDVGVSPSGEQVAWALGDRVAVELGDSHEVFEVPQTRNLSYRFVDFLDEEHLVMLGWTGNIELVNWREGERISVADLGSDVQSAQLARDPRGEGGGAMLVRTNLWQNPALVELLPDAIGPRYLTHAAANLVGLLNPPNAQREGWGAWTLDGAGALREFHFAQLAAGLDLNTALNANEVLELGVPEQLLIAPDGTRYWVRTQGARPTLHIERAGQSPTQFELSPGFVTLLSLSHDGSRLAIIQQRDPGQVLTIYEPDEMRPLWAQPLSPVNGLAWADAGQAIGVATTTGGGVLLDGQSGEPRTARCGLAFERRHAPPVILGAPGQLSVCEL